jgi:hypothetical protein
MKEPFIITNSGVTEEKLREMETIILVNSSLGIIMEKGLYMIKMVIINRDILLRYISL